MKKSQIWQLTIHKMTKVGQLWEKGILFFSLFFIFSLFCVVSLYPARTVFPRTHLEYPGSLKSRSVLSPEEEWEKELEAELQDYEMVASDADKNLDSHLESELDDLK